MPTDRERLARLEEKVERLEKAEEERKKELSAVKVGIISLLFTLLTHAVKYLLTR